jgi:dTDP-4-amino-4,6-dideoxygalactose transaminase
MNIAKWPVAGTRERDLVLGVLESPQWGGFNEIVGKFEEEFARYQHCRYAVSTFNGTVSLEMMLEVAGIGPGDEVIVPAISFVSTATAVSRVGATPVFVDIEPLSFNIDPAAVERALTEKTRAILAVHFGGPLCRIDAISDIAERYSLLLFEDAAHAHGSEWNGKRAGSFGFGASFSFQNGKVMTSGEGGIVTTNDEDFFARCRSFANQGRQAGASFFHHFTLGSNFRLTALQAAVLIGQLERLDGDISLRERNERRIREALHDVDGLTFQQYPDAVNRHSHYLLLGQIDEGRFGATRDHLQKHLSKLGVPCTPFYPHTLYNNPIYTKGGARVEPCPVAEARVKDSFWLPHRVLMSEDSTIEGVIRGIQEAAGR